MSKPLPPSGCAWAAYFATLGLVLYVIAAEIARMWVWIKWALE
jgi:hypothetical protein